MVKDATRAIGYHPRQSPYARFHYRARPAPACPTGTLKALLTTVVVSGIVFCAQPSAAQPLIELMSVGIGGQSAEGNSNTPTPNANASAVAFSSNAFNLVLPLEENQQSDVYVRLRADLPSTERVSVTPGGGEPNGASQQTGFAPAISGNGALVAFSSRATDLIPGGDRRSRKCFRLRSGRQRDRAHQCRH